jgi:hypothetical protein
MAIIRNTSTTPKPIKNADFDAFCGGRLGGKEFDRESDGGIVGVERVGDTRATSSELMTILAIAAS